MHQLFLLLSLSFLSYTESSTACNRTCGNTNVPYPFGFSPGCAIRLSCNATSAVLLEGLYPVVNITADGTMLVRVPPSCNRTTAEALRLLGGNYALTWQTGLFLRNCTSPLGCSIPTDVVSEIVRGNGSCGGRGDSTRCLSNATARALWSPEIVKNGTCGDLFTSVVYVSYSELTPALLFGVAELGWWLKGTCAGDAPGSCAANATCVDVDTPTGNVTGFRCACNDGFDGDGYASGDRCRFRVSTCSGANKKSGTCGDKAKVGLLVGGVTAGVAAALGIALFCNILRRRRRRAASRSAHLAAMRALSEASSCSVPVFSYHDVARATNSFSHTNRLGTGAYGTVYVGNLPSSSPPLVAIKRIRRRHDDGGGGGDGDVSAAEIAALMNEIKLISSLRHPNLIRLLGCCFDRGEQILVYEFMPNGALSQHLHRRGDERHRGLSWRVRLRIASETANAIQYLHGMQPPIYHRDVKSSNILLDASFRPKLADFGLSRAGWAEGSHISTAPQGTPGYVDPEYHQNFHLSDKSDVYSFGVVLLEIITALKVVDFNRTPTEVNLASLALDRIGKGRLEEIVDPVLLDRREEWVMESVRGVAELAFRCLAFQKDVRPSMSEVADELRRIRDCVPDPGPEIGPGSGSGSGSGEPGKTGLEAELGFEEKSAQTKKAREASPVSVVQEAWVSEQSSPSTNGSMPRLVA